MLSSPLGEHGVIWLLLAIVALLMVIAGCALVAAGALRTVAAHITSRSSFTDLVQPVLDRGELDEVIQLARTRLRDFPDDAAAHYYLGSALVRKGEKKAAHAHLLRVRALESGWNVEAMIGAVERDLATTSSSPDLRVVAATHGEPPPAPKQP
jgi:cytochrome c-type biogenesis protein CcmH/NrfG